MAEEDERINKGNYLECTTLSFIHPIEGIKIAEYVVPIKVISINYERTRSNLIGMDILKDFDRHEGISRVTGEPIMLACHKDNINQDYLEAMRQHFGYIPVEFLESKAIAKAMRKIWVPEIKKLGKKNYDYITTADKCHK